MTKANIRNSTTDFLVFTKDSGASSIEVRVQDDNVWLTQKAIGELFDIDRSVVAKHLKNIFDSEELEKFYEKYKSILPDDITMWENLFK